MDYTLCQARALTLLGQCMIELKEEGRRVRRYAQQLKYNCKFTRRRSLDKEGLGRHREEVAGGGGEEEARWGEEGGGGRWEGKGAREKVAHGINIDNCVADSSLFWDPNRAFLTWRATMAGLPPVSCFMNGQKPVVDKAIIVGGGLGGLSAAIQLRKIGIDAHFAPLEDGALLSEFTVGPLQCP
eukprot:Gb_24103 [translate_table: standard]